MPFRLLSTGVWAFGLTFVVFKVVNGFKSMRMSPGTELDGLDVPEFGRMPERAPVGYCSIL